MITLTEKAIQAIRQQIADPENMHLRVRLQSAGCCDPVLALLIDKPETEDQTLVVDGINLLVDGHTAATCGLIDIDYVEKSWNQGFVITSEKPLSEWQGMSACKIIGL